MAFRSQGLVPRKTAGVSQFSPLDSPQISSHHGLHSIHEEFPFGLGGQDYTFHTLSTLSILQHRIRQLELALQCQAPEALAKQHTVAEGIASAVSQVVVATASLLRQLFGSSVHTMASDLQLINMMSRMTGLEFGMLQQATDTPLSSFSSNFSLNPGESLHMISHDILGSDLEISDMAEQRHAGEQDTGRSFFQTNVDYNISTYLDMDVGTNGHLEVPNSHMVNGVTATQVSADERESLEGLKDEEDDGEAENLPPGSFELIEMNDAEILAEHTHFCKICGKGFKRDANLRMHMRGHGDEYKTPAALARPADFSQGPAMTRLRRYSCPYVGCKRNKRHKKFQPLKTLLCVKNHYRRSHCDKIHTCSKCSTKKFSVLADLKTHEKHCGCDKWRCSCGTTFSRKDKLLGHIGLFAGHTPAIPLHETEGMITGFNSVNNLLGVNLDNQSEVLFGSGGETF